MNDKDFSLAEKILNRLNEKGARLGKPMVLVIQAVLEEQEAPAASGVCPHCHDKLFCAMCGEHVDSPFQVLSSGPVSQY